MAENYPFKILIKKYADEFMREIENHPGTSSATDPKIQYKLYEKGYIKIACLDDETKNFVLELARKFKLRYPKPKILAIDENNLLTIIKMSCSLKNTENFFAADGAFMREIQDKNKLDTSKWFIEPCRCTSSQQKVCFSVDLLSAGYISYRNFHLDIRGECVRVLVRSKEELEVMYASSLLQ